MMKFWDDIKCRHDKLSKIFMNFSNKWVDNKGNVIRGWKDVYDPEKVRERRRKHLEEVRKNMEKKFPKDQPCLHDNCPKCFGTGIKKDGTLCIHMISCPCPKCNPYSM